jgi:hypothetical protein
MRSGVAFWALIYVLNLVAFVGLFRLHLEFRNVPLVLALLMAATNGCCAWALGRALELRRKTRVRS